MEVTPSNLNPSNLYSSTHQRAFDSRNLSVSQLPAVHYLCHFNHSVQEQQPPKESLPARALHLGSSLFQSWSNGPQEKKKGKKKRLRWWAIITGASAWKQWQPGANGPQQVPACSALLLVCSLIQSQSNGSQKVLACSALLLLVNQGATAPNKSLPAVHYFWLLYSFIHSLHT